ncbi:acetyltransferase-like isoleucine patch superfamily enzyme [Cellulophaga sp. RHA19]|uniref:acyltransferase n=1 Tax=Cellulophaga sp. RHA19 TaxID=1798237 RepID=UPI000C2B5EB0|nr:acyltransferase [Cellulophaga sp. RHA19]PKB42609.1 acetyltransferase-like isoleucine patch superfamily enzyme [Cellulophaga sp. RHA19]
MITKIISKLKGDSSYNIRSRYSSREWFVILYERGFQVLRGFIAKFFLLKTKGLCFKGQSVTVKHRSLFTSGKNLILDNNVFINALSEKGIRFGDNVTISRNCTLICTGVISHKGVGITIGNDTGINSYCYLGGQGGIEIGDNVIIGPQVKIFSENHNFSDGATIIKNQGVTRLGVRIENDCWIGSGATILDGVVLKKRTVVAAGSVVNQSFEGNSLIGGIPAKLIKKI